MFRSLALVLTISAFVSLGMPHFARAVEEQADDVFMDDGDGEVANLDAFNKGSATVLPAKGQKQAALEDEDETESNAPAQPEKKVHRGQKSAKGAAGGQFVVTKNACPMMRSPASEGEPMLVIKSEKKIWVEKVDGNWVKGFNKAGEGGFIQKDCVN